LQWAGATQMQSREVARWFRSGLAVSGPVVCRCLSSPTMLRFHFPLIEPDGRISRIRLSDKAGHAFAHALSLSPATPATRWGRGYWLH
jgi:hypothetical protein